MPKITVELDDQVWVTVRHEIYRANAALKTSVMANYCREDIDNLDTAYDAIKEALKR